MLPITPATLAEARRFNRLLSLLPRFTIRKHWTPRLIQSLLRLSQTGADFKMRRAGLTIDTIDTPVPIRILRPAGQVRAVILDYHGGGWAIGNPQLNDQRNAALIDACQVAVVSVDYRLAPATALEDMLADCLAAARWLLEGGLREYVDLPVIIIGESAGAHLAAATLLELKRWPDLLAKVSGAVLYYGVYDLVGSPSAHAAGSDTLVLDGPDLVSALARLTPHLSDAERRLPPLSPLYGELAGLPPALLIGGALDPLIDDTRLLAARWAAVAPVELHVLPEAPHGFIRFPTAMAKLTQDWVHSWINALIEKPAAYAAPGSGAASLTRPGLTPASPSA
ncbi:MAG: alpha/beta hydrolase [Massilia sp.]|jgi:acetyl esterase/lipase|nr:alpha/beta hydrolase [Massilia sp.]